MLTHSHSLQTRSATLLWTSLIWLFSASSSVYAQSLQIEALTEGLNHPWALVFLPDGDLLVSERAGRLQRVAPDGAIRRIEGTPEAYVASQGGYQDLVLHPDHAHNGWIYLSLVHGSAEANATRVVRGRLEGMNWIDEQLVFTAQANKNTPVHHGARMAFLPDGTLLLSVGDGFNYREAAQALDSHFGKILRINDDGSLPADNPYVDRSEADPFIFSIGHRNPQGLVVDTDSGRIWSHEHGPRRGDELNLIAAGQNYGWPVVTAGRDYTGAQITPFRTREGMVDPAWVWADTVAPAGLTLYRGALFPDWSGHLLVAGLVDRDLRLMRLDGDQVISDEPLALGLNRRLRDVRVGPNGAIYVLTDEANGAVLRITPSD